MYVCMYVCMYVHIYMHGHVYTYHGTRTNGDPYSCLVSPHQPFVRMSLFVLSPYIYTCTTLTFPAQQDCLLKAKKLELSISYMNKKLQSYADMTDGASQCPLPMVDPQGDIQDPLGLDDGEIEDSFQQEVKNMDNASLQEKCSSLKDSSKKYVYIIIPDISSVLICRILK